MFYAGGQTDRHDIANSRFSQFCERAQILLKILNKVRIYVKLFFFFCLIKLYIPKRNEDVEGKVEALLSFALDRDQWSVLNRREVPHYPLDFRLGGPHCQTECADEQNNH